MRKPTTIFNRLIFLIVFFLHAERLSAQINRDTAEEIKLIASTTDDSVKMIAYLSLGRFYIDINNDNSLANAQKAYLLSLEIKSKNYEAQSLDFMGAVELRRGNSDQSLTYLLKALKLFELLKDSTYLIVVNRNLGGVYKSQHDTIKAREYYSNALKIKPRFPSDTLFYSWVLMDLGDLFLTMNKPDSALYCAQQSFDISMKLAVNYSKKYLPFALITIGKIYETTGKFKEALAKYKQAVNFAFNNYNLQAASDNYMAIAFLFRRINNIDSGFYYAKKAFVIARQVNNPQAIELSSSYLKDHFKNKNQLDSAFIYQEIMGRAKDSLLSLEKIRQVQNISFSEQMKQQEILRQQEQLKNNIKQEQEQLKNRIKLYSLLAALIFILVIAFILWRNNGQKQKAKVKIEKAYEELKSTQAQLIQSEKMASLGELTAGVAHEIQNPLNFVNNFSDVNTELIDEMQQELKNGKLDEAISISDTIKENEQKINQHGKRADSIVKGMLQHSRNNTGQKELTEINTVTEEYLRLCYHGLRAKDKSFNISMQIDLDESIQKINIIPQDFGRALLNLFNNAFYAVTEKKKSDSAKPGYEPLVFVSTKNLVNKIEIRVKDNGIGIPQKIVNKIFQPFFTTKPTGLGTGLGLSLSYDIITKEHGGVLKVETVEGEFSEFIIVLPKT